MNKMLLVKCRVSSGIFGSEYYVMVQNSSAYVSRRNVKVNAEPADKEVEGQVRAYWIAAEKGRVLIELPGEAVVGGLRTWVPEDQLEAVG